MARKEADLTACMITQALHRDYWNLSDAERAIISAGKVNEVTDLLVAKLESVGMVVIEAYGIVHDRDTVMEWDEIAMQEVVAYKTHHIHAIIKFAKGKGGTVAKIANAVGLEPQFVEKPARGKFAYDNMLSYLVHIKYIDKCQYEPSEVYTARGRNYINVFHEREEDWLKGRAKIQVEKAKIDADWLEEKILTGEVTKQQVILTDKYYAIYARNKRRCEDAFDTYGQHKIYKTMQKMEDGEFKTSVFYVTGKSHSGKSYFTDNLVKSIQTKVKEEMGETWTVCTCAASNPFDEYLGQEILVMDDLRGIALTASDWLKLLDPDRINMGSARYRNKQMACRVIIINSERDVLDFFYYMKSIGGDDRSEAMDQFLRRIMAKIIVYRVPDNPSERRLAIGTMEETEHPYTVTKNMKTLTLHHAFDATDTKDISVEDGLERLTAMVMQNNNLNNPNRNIRAVSNLKDEAEKQELYHRYLVKAGWEYFDDDTQTFKMYDGLNEKQKPSYATWYSTEYIKDFTI